MDPVPAGLVEQSELLFATLDRRAGLVELLRGSSRLDDRDVEQPGPKAAVPARYELDMRATASSRGGFSVPFVIASAVVNPRHRRTAEPGPAR
jgi:hypothetical protein